MTSKKTQTLGTYSKQVYSILEASDKIQIAIIYTFKKIQKIYIILNNSTQNSSEQELKGA